LITTDKSTGTLALYLGPSVWKPANPFEEAVGGAQDAITLSATQYIVIRDEKDGRLELVKGPGKWFPASPYVRLIGKIREAQSLSPTQVRPSASASLSQPAPDIPVLSLST
jgi:hypothetical protein